MRKAVFLLLACAGCSNLGGPQKTGQPPLTLEDVAAAHCIIIEHGYSCALSRSGHSLRCVFEENGKCGGERIDNFPDETARTPFECPLDTFSEVRKILLESKFFNTTKRPPVPTGDKLNIQCGNRKREFFIQSGQKEYEPLLDYLSALAATGKTEKASVHAAK